VSLVDLARPAAADVGEDERLHASAITCAMIAAVATAVCQSRANTSPGADATHEWGRGAQPHAKRAHTLSAAVSLAAPRFWLARLPLPPSGASSCCRPAAGVASLRACERVWGPAVAASPSQSSSGDLQSGAPQLGVLPKVRQEIRETRSSAAVLEPRQSRRKGGGLEVGRQAGVDVARATRLSRVAAAAVAHLVRLVRGLSGTGE
jgi:hypothetical protein